MSRAPGREAASLVALGRGVLWTVMAVGVTRTVADADLWGNLRFGLDLLSSHRLTTADPYSFTQDLPWINHEWLPQLMMAAAYQLAGTAGLVLLKALIVGTTLWLVAGAFKDAVRPVRDVAAAFVLWASLPVTLAIRAQLWTFLGLAVLCRVLYGTSRSRRYYVPLIFVVWANCHVGWTVGFAVLCLWAVETLRNGGRPDRRCALIVTPLAFLATVVNPYGVQFWQFLGTVAYVSRTISEWQPLWTFPFANWLPWILAAMLAIAFGRSAPRLTPERAVCIAGLAFASLRAVKFVNVFVEVTVLLLAPAICRRFARQGSAEPAVDPSFRRLNAAALAVVALFGAAAAWPSFQCLPSGSWRPDPVAAHALIDAQPAGRIAVFFDWGEYVIWHLGPRLRVSFDGRYDLIYSKAVIDEQRGVADATGPGTQFVERARPEYLWFPQWKSELKAWLPAHGYRIDVDTEESFVAVRADVAEIHAGPPREFGCFPSP